MVIHHFSRRKNYYRYRIWYCRYDIGDIQLVKPIWYLIDYIFVVLFTNQRNPFVQPFCPLDINYFPFFFILLNVDQRSKIIIY